MFETPPRVVPGGARFRESVLVGRTALSAREVEDLLKRFSREYLGDRYHLLYRNCNHFCEDLCAQLTGSKPPSWVRCGRARGRARVPAPGARSSRARCASRARRAAPDKPAGARGALPEHLHALLPAREARAAAPRRRPCAPPLTLIFPRAPAIPSHKRSIRAIARSPTVPALSERMADSMPLLAGQRTIAGGAAGRAAAAVTGALHAARCGPRGRAARRGALTRRPVCARAAPKPLSSMDARSGEAATASQRAVG